MAGWVKVWTCINHENWFISLTAMGKLVYLECLIFAGEQGGTGEITFAGYTDLAHRLDIDRRTLRHCIDILAMENKLAYVQNSPRVLRLKIVNYLKWQRFRNGTQVQNCQVSSEQKSTLNKNKNNSNSVGNEKFSNRITLNATNHPLAAVVFAIKIIEENSHLALDGANGMQTDSYIEMLDRCINNINNTYQPGTLAWVKANNFALNYDIDQTEERIAEAYKNKVDSWEFKHIVGIWHELIIAAINDFKNRSVQGSAW